MAYDIRTQRRDMCSAGGGHASQRLPRARRPALRCGARCTAVAPTSEDAPEDRRTAQVMSVHESDTPHVRACLSFDQRSSSKLSVCMLQARSENTRLMSDLGACSLGPADRPQPCHLRFASFWKSHRALAQVVVFTEASVKRMNEACSYSGTPKCTRSCGLRPMCARRVKRWCSTQGNGAATDSASRILKS